MKSKNIFIVILVVVVVIIVYYTMRSGGSHEDYITQIQKERDERDQFMRSSSESPFSGEEEEFTTLKYFPVDPQYRIVADLQPIEDKKVVTMPTSDGKEQRYLEYAYARFDLNNRSNQLLILEVMDMGPLRGTLFLAFGDGTSAVETYGAGRYLDVKKVPGAATITLDFNLAYNPYCAYTDRFSCPLPPRENLLDIPIRAGEKIYHD